MYGLGCVVCGGVVCEYVWCVCEYVCGVGAFVGDVYGLGCAVCLWGVMCVSMYGVLSMCVMWKHGCIVCGVSCVWC